MGAYFKGVLLALVFTALAGVGSAQTAQGIAGVVYTMTNQIAGNEVLVFHRAANGSLALAGSFATGGQGSGGGLGNQAGLALTHDNQWLLAVNALSNEVSLFEVRQDGLRLSDVVNSAGIRPVSVTVRNHLVYVLNGGGNGNIAGFRRDQNGNLTLIAGSIQPLSQNGGTGPAQIAFDPSGEVLVVTEKATNRILTFTVDKDGIASGPSVHTSSGQTPFGFEFGLRRQLFVSEAAGGAQNASSVSSYQLLPGGGLQVISPSVPTTESAACWVVITNDGRFAMTSNTDSDSISAYTIGFDGTLLLRDADGRTGVTAPGGTPIDLAFSRDSRFLYSLDSGTRTISGFRVESDGGLTPISTGVAGLPLGSNGLVAR